jgi:hypothetical protein
VLDHLVLRGAQDDAVAGGLDGLDGYYIAVGGEGPGAIDPDKAIAL